LAENNRTTFHYAEGESELVSGFSVEYGGGEFAIIFWRSMQVFFLKVYFFCIIFLGSDFYSFLFFYFRLTFVSFLFVCFRGTIPRFRYDKLM